MIHNANDSDNNNDKPVANMQLDHSFSLSLSLSLSLTQFPVSHCTHDDAGTQTKLISKHTNMYICMCVYIKDICIYVCHRLS